MNHPLPKNAREERLCYEKVLALQFNVCRGSRLMIPIYDDRNSERVSPRPRTVKFDSDRCRRNSNPLSELSRGNTLRGYVWTNKNEFESPHDESHNRFHRSLKIRPLFRFYNKKSLRVHKSHACSNRRATLQFAKERKENLSTTI